ncbi:MAG: T9SS type A sorting domain-containing protein [Bacteroidia bacterium]|nr:T9SS type A sorting domain-containing protein [Bacteroidia bacterium]
MKADDICYGPYIETDADGNVYLSAFTTSAAFPTTPGAYQTTYGRGSIDCFVAKFNNDLTELLACTFLGGSGTETETYTPAGIPHPCSFLPQLEPLIKASKAGKSLHLIPDTAVATNNQPIELAHSLKLFPNPCRGQVTLRITAPQSKDKVTLSIYNSMGSLVGQREVSGNFNHPVQHQMDIRSYKPGIYYIRLTYGTITTEVNGLIRL